MAGEEGEGAHLVSLSVVCWGKENTLYVVFRGKGDTLGVTTYGCGVHWESLVLVLVLVCSVQFTCGVCLHVSVIIYTSNLRSQRLVKYCQT